MKEIARKTAVQQAKKAAEKKAAMRLLITTSEIWIPIVLAAVGITSIFSLLLFMI
ncbi:MAG: hypothetical protein U9Q15_04125 [Patescibacteria group bacterium]|nr:hypothetical protein [Patescibacteria group bacterium]